jgi:hypothetical protein
MSNCEQQLQMTNHHCAGAIDAAEQENIEVISSVIPGSRLHESIHNLVDRRIDEGECGLVTLLAVPAKHKPGVRTGNRMSCAGEGLVVSKPDMQGVITARQAGDSTLPCRGCTRNCSRYGRCNHTPWRSADMSRKRASQQIDGTGCINLIKTCSVA